MDVTAIIRGDNKSAAPRAIAKDLFDLTGEDLNGFDVVVDVPPPFPEAAMPVVNGHGKTLEKFVK